MTTGDEQAAVARNLLAGGWHGVLSTHSLQHEGYPFGTLVPYIISQDGQPVMLLSHLSQHTRNINSNTRCGLLVSEQGDGDIQQLARLSAIGNLLPDENTAVAEKYFRYFPAARMYFEQLGFRFYRFNPLHFHWNGGFATARWFSNDRIIKQNPLTPAEQAELIERMNLELTDIQWRYLAEDGLPVTHAPVMMVGVDAEGIDLRSEQHLCRITLPQTVSNADDANRVMHNMAYSNL